MKPQNTFEITIREIEDHEVTSWDTFYLKPRHVWEVRRANSARTEVYPHIMKQGRAYTERGAMRAAKRASKKIHQRDMAEIDTCQYRSFRGAS